MICILVQVGVFRSISYPKNSTFHSYICEELVKWEIVDRTCLITLTESHLRTLFIHRVRKLSDRAHPIRRTSLISRDFWRRKANCTWEEECPRGVKASAFQMLGRFNNNKKTGFQSQSYSDIFYGFKGVKDEAIQKTGSKLLWNYSWEYKGISWRKG